MKKIILVLLLLFTSAFAPLAKIATNTVDPLFNLKIVTFLDDGNLKLSWVIIILLTIVLFVIDFYTKKKVLYRIILFILIIFIYLIRLDIKNAVDEIYYNSSGFLPASLSWGWYLIYLAILILVFGNNDSNKN